EYLDLKAADRLLVNQSRHVDHRYGSHGSSQPYLTAPRPVPLVRPSDRFQRRVKSAIGDVRRGRCWLLGCEKPATLTKAPRCPAPAPSWMTSQFHYHDGVDSIATSGVPGCCPYRAGE